MSTRVIGNAAQVAMERTGTFDEEAAFDALMAEIEEKNATIERIETGAGTARQTEMLRLVENVEHNIMRGYLEEDPGYPLKMLPDLRRLRQILRGDS